MCKLSRGELARQDVHDHRRSTAELLRRKSDEQNERRLKLELLEILCAIHDDEN